eukprot:13182028-Ditylum_brightwellii.AAC.1
MMYDEKWFWGLSTRAGAKTCDELGIDSITFKAYHKNHINKMMGIAFTAFTFGDYIENGGEAIKLGPVIRGGGDIYLVDCDVTGSSRGTDIDPNFPLDKLFREVIFPQVGSMVGGGGKFEGYLPICQGDNAGLHKYRTKFQSVTNYCKEK